MTDWTEGCKDCEFNVVPEDGGCCRATPCPQLLEERIQEFRDGYVNARWPCLKGYAYKADMRSVEDGRVIMDEILSRVIDIDMEGCCGHPMLYTKDGQKLSVLDSDDWPQPSSEEWE